MVRRTPEKHDSIPGKLRTNSTPALEPFSPALSSRLLFPHATRTHARTHTHARASSRRKLRRHDAEMGHRWSRIRMEHENREGKSHATISRRGHDNTGSRREPRGSPSRLRLTALRAPRTRNSAQCNRTDHAVVTSATCLHYHRGPCTDVNLRQPRDSHI